MRTAVVAGMGLILTVMPGWAHHSFAAEFDAKKPIELRGTITKVEFINPHAWIHIDVKGPDGKVVNWAIEAGSPNGLFRRGVTQYSLVVGTEIVVYGYLSKSADNIANGERITLADGRKLFVGSSGSGAPDKSQDEAPKK